MRGLAGGRPGRAAACLGALWGPPPLPSPGGPERRNRAEKVRKYDFSCQQVHQEGHLQIDRSRCPVGLTGDLWRIPRGFSASFVFSQKFSLVDFCFFRLSEIDRNPAFNLAAGLERERLAISE